MIHRLKRMIWSLRAEAKPDFERLRKVVSTGLVGDVLFICFGNICRSPTCELIWNRLRNEEAPHLPTAISAGLSTTQGSRTPPEYAAIAGEFGIDLSQHGSRLVSEEMVKSAGAIFLMDLSNWGKFRKEFPNAMHRTFLLAPFLGDGKQEIIDPYGRDRETARQVVSQIIAAVKKLQSEFTRK